MRLFLIQLITAIIGTLGFAIMFKVQPKFLALSAAIGGGCHCVYSLFSMLIKTNSFVAALFATIFVAILAEIFARLLHSPALVFLSPGLIPIVPGSALYNTMKYIITRDPDKAVYYGLEALKIASGIAGGIVVVSVLVSIYNGFYIKFKKKRT